MSGATRSSTATRESGGVRASVAIPAILAVTFRQLLGRRRTLLLALLSFVPVLLAIAYRASGQSAVMDFVTADYDAVAVTILLPIVAVLFGTATFGAEIEDGTIVYLLAKPVGRWRIVVAKVLGAAAFTAIMTVLSVVVAGAIALLSAGDEGTAAIVAFVVAMIVGSFCYGVVFATLSLFTRRALVIGIAYVLVWEGGLATLLPGIANLSIRQYALGAAKGEFGQLKTSLEPTTALLLAAVVIVVGLVIATWRLSRYEVASSGD